MIRKCDRIEDVDNAIKEAREMIDKYGWKDKYILTSLNLYPSLSTSNVIIEINWIDQLQKMNKESSKSILKRTNEIIGTLNTWERIKEQNENEQQEN